MDKDASIKKAIITMIEKSKKEKIEGTAFREDSWLNSIRFGDVMDIVLLYLSLEPDLEKFGKMDTGEFYRLAEYVWREWSKNNNDFPDIIAPWSAGPGPMDGSAGPAEMYLRYYTSITSHSTISAFFSQYGQGPSYLEHVKIMTLPKWKKKRNFKKLGRAFNLAKMVCEAMKKDTER